MKQVGSVWPSHHGFQEETMRSYENPFQELKVSHERLGISWVLSRIMSRPLQAVRAQVLEMIKAKKEEEAEGAGHGCMAALECKKKKKKGQYESVARRI